MSVYSTCMYQRVCIVTCRRAIFGLRHGTYYISLDISRHLTVSPISCLLGVNNRNSKLGGVKVNLGVTHRRAPAYKERYGKYRVNPKIYVFLMSFEICVYIYIYVYIKVDL